MNDAERYAFLRTAARLVATTEPSGDGRMLYNARSAIVGASAAIVAVLATDGDPIAWGRLTLTLRDAAECLARTGDGPESSAFEDVANAALREYEGCLRNVAASR